MLYIYYILLGGGGYILNGVLQNILDGVLYIAKCYILNGVFKFAGWWLVE